MFSELLLKNNLELFDYGIYLHQKGHIQPDTYILDYDRMLLNYSMISQKAKEYNLETLVMTKQFGRHPLLIKSLSNMGAKFVAVDFREGQHIINCGGSLGHIGHLVQMPIHSIPKILAHKPEFVTLYSLEHAKIVNDYAYSNGFVQNVLLRVVKQTYEGQESQIFTQEELLLFAKQIQKLSNVKLVGLTSFPCFLFDEKTQKVIVTENTLELDTMYKYLKTEGFELTVKNLPSHNTYDSIPLLAEWNATHIEPGHALTGTCPFHKSYPNINQEKIAIAYISEISHHDNDNSYFYGGGYYRRSHWQKSITSNRQSFKIIPPNDSSIDYTIGIKGILPIGETIVSSFRTQIFVTRSHVALIKGLSTNTPQLMGICDSQGIMIKE